MSIADKGRVALETLRVRCDIVGNGLSTCLLFALDEHAHIHRECSIDGHQGFERFEDEHRLSLIVACSPTIEIAVAHRRLEWRRLPQLHRINWLYVIVTIDQYRRLACRLEPIAINKRMALCCNDLHMLKTNVSQLVRCILCRTANISGMFW